MKKKFLLMSLAAATLLAGCSKESLSEGGDGSLKGQIAVKAFSSQSIGVDTRTPFLETSLAGEAADVYALTQPLGTHNTPATMFTDAHGRGTMTFSTEYVGFDRTGFVGDLLLPTDGQARYLCGFYPSGWTLGKRKDDASTEALIHSFDGKTDLMSTYFKAGDDVIVAYNNPDVAPDKAEMTFKHLLARYNVKVIAEDAEGIASWGAVKSIALNQSGTANNVVEIQKVDQVKYYNDNTKTAPSFYKLTGTPSALTYTDNLFGGTNFATSQQLTTTLTNVCYAMIAPVTVDTDAATPELTLEVVTILADGKEKTSVLPVSVKRDQLAAVDGVYSTRGYSITLTLHFRVASIEALAEVEQWKDGGSAEDNVDNMKPVSKLINLSKDGTANCYLVTQTSATGYSFDATVRGNNSTVAGIDYDGLPKLTDATVARVIWQTGTSATTGLVVDPATVKLEGGKVKFTLGTATEGNAVIGLFASSAATAPCLWSWHIWRVNGDLPADVDCTKNPSPVSASKDFKMMALNLGAFNNATGDVKSIGLIYQWGRKDPFPGPKDFTNTEPTNIYGSVSNNGTVVSLAGRYTALTIASASGIGTEAWAVQYPGVFITSSSDWMVTKNDALWGTPWVDGGVPVGSGSFNNNQGVKSIYDPCPVGYRVPPQDTWNQAVSGTWTNGQALTGMASSGSFWFPAEGFRVYSTASLSIEYPGSYWSSSPHSSVGLAGRVDFNYSGVYPGGDYYRASAMPVRCVLESSIKN